MMLYGTEFVEANGIDAAINKAAKKTTSIALAKASHYAVAKGIVQSTVKGGVDHLGRRGAVVAIESSTGLGFAQGANAANAALTSSKLLSFLPATSATIG